MRSGNLKAIQQGREIPSEVRHCRRTSPDLGQSVSTLVATHHAISSGQRCATSSQMRKSVPRELMSTMAGALRGPSSAKQVTPPLTLANCILSRLVCVFPSGLKPMPLRPSEAAGASHVKVDPNALLVIVQARLGSQTHRRVGRAKQIVVSPLHDLEEEAMLERPGINVEEFATFGAVVKHPQRTQLRQ